MALSDLVGQTQVSTNKAEPSVVGTAPHLYLPIFPSNSPLSPMPIPKLTYCKGVSVAGLKKCAAARFTLQGHTDQFMSVAFSPDSKRIGSAPDDKSVRAWDAERGVQIGSLTISWSASHSFCNLSQQYSRQ